MRRSLAILLLALASGCARTVQVELPALPAVSLDSSRVAVVAVERDCREIADALVQQLNVLGFQVDPGAAVRLEVSSCERPLQPVQVDVEIEQDVDRRRLSIEGRAHAVVAVQVDGHPQAWLIGASSQIARGNWNDPDPIGLSRMVQRSLVDGVASDLADQLRPLPRLVDRRVYARAPDGTAHALHNRAVDAEARGELQEAFRLAQLAHDENPSARARAYVEELELRIARGTYTP